MNECCHTITTSRKDEKGDFCENCGIKVYDVETRTCDGCARYQNVIHGAVCKKHRMAISPDMHVTFKVSEGSCWEDRRNYV